MTDTLAPTPAPTELGQADVIIRHPITAIVPNRYQRRHIDPAALDIVDLAQNIRAHGLQNPVIGRWLPHPSGGPSSAGVVELVSGHRRTAAFQMLAQADPAYRTIPLIIRALSDRQMFEACAIENAHRLDLSGIEKAESLRDYLAEFKVGQAEAGALFGIGQTAVSHLLRLLKLPAEVQALVDSRELAERTARALVPLAEWDAGVVVSIAKAALKQPLEERDEEVADLITSNLRKKAPMLSGDNTSWPLNWPAKPLPIPDYRAKPGTPAEAPACTGCKFNLQRDDYGYCLRPACHAAKVKLWPAQAAAAAAVTLGIAVAAKGEKVTMLWDGSSYNYERRQQVQKAVRAKRPELRLVPADKVDRYSGSGTQDVTGSRYVFLAATSVAAIDTWLGEAKGKTVKAPIPKNETPAAKALRVNGEAELKEERAAERSAYNKAWADGLYLFDRAAHLVADNTVAAGGLLAWAALHPNVLRSQVIELNDARRALESAAKLGRSSDQFGARAGKPAPATDELDHARRKYIAYTELVKDVAGYDAPAKLFSAFGKMVADLAKCALDSFGVALPAGWDFVPIHHTAYNCWQCGSFAGNPKGFTKAELAEGWGGGAKAPGGYHCPVHKPAPAPKGRPLTLLLGAIDDSEWEKMQAAAKAKMEAAEDVRRHTSSAKKDTSKTIRPAPKPSAAKTPARKSTVRKPAKGAEAGQRARATKKGGRR